MRLQLDTSTTSLGDSARVGSSAPAGASETSRAPGILDQKGDRVGISGTSAALNRIASERGARIQQLTADVRSGAYSVPAAGVSKAIVAQAFLGEVE